MAAAGFAAAEFIGWATSLVRIFSQENNWQAGHKCFK
jgi:hypothetical protein